MSDKIFKLGLIGGGKGGLEVFNVFSRTSVAHIEYVCDLDSNAPAMAAAKAHGVPTITTLDAAFALPVDIILEVTGSKKVSEIVDNHVREKGIYVLDYHMAEFIFQLTKDPFFGIDAGENTQKDRFMSFQVNGEDFGIEISGVREIVNAQKVTHLPDLPEFVQGIINLRGNILPVIDMRKRFHVGQNTAVTNNERGSVVVVDVDNRGVGLAVDQMNGVVVIPEDQISLPPKFGQQSSRRFVRGIGKTGENVTMLLNTSELLDAEEWDIIGRHVE